MSQQLLMRLPSLDALPPMPALAAEFLLRELTVADAGELARILHTSFDDAAFTLDHVATIYLPDPKNIKTFGIFDGATLAATATVRLDAEAFPGAGYVHYVAVDPAYRGRRLSNPIMLAVLHEFRRMGLREAVLETDDHRLPAIKTYQNLGFVPEHRHETHPERWAQIAADMLAAAGL